MHGNLFCCFLSLIFSKYLCSVYAQYVVFIPFLVSYSARINVNLFKSVKITPYCLISAGLWTTMFGVVVPDHVFTSGLETRDGTDNRKSCEFIHVFCGRIVHVSALI